MCITLSSRSCSSIYSGFVLHSFIRYYCFLHIGHICHKYIINFWLPRGCQSVEKSYWFFYIFLCTQWFTALSSQFQLCFGHLLNFCVCSRHRKVSIISFLHLILARNSKTMLKNTNCSRHFCVIPLDGHPSVFNPLV